jgi:NhaP-type Na+/H+ or K+/H+ antiporter
VLILLLVTLLFFLCLINKLFLSKIILLIISNLLLGYHFLNLIFLNKIYLFIPFLIKRGKKKERNKKINFNIPEIFPEFIIK